MLVQLERVLDLSLSPSSKVRVHAKAGNRRARRPASRPRGHIHCGMGLFVRPPCHQGVLARTHVRVSGGPGSRVDGPAVTSLSRLCSALRSQILARNAMQLSGLVIRPAAWSEEEALPAPLPLFACALSACDHGLSKHKTTTTPQTTHSNQDADHAEVAGIGGGDGVAGAEGDRAVIGPAGGDHAALAGRAVSRRRRRIPGREQPQHSRRAGVTRH